MAEPVFSKWRRVLPNSPTTASRSPSPSRSAKLGVLLAPHVDAVERIGNAGLLSEDGRNRRARVLEIAQGAGEFPDDSVEVAVAVEVPEAGRADRAPALTQMKGLAAPVRSVKAGAVAVPMFSK